ncbi:hypothetical protein L798_02348 [Zootermopsis nevadensis]|uniref:Uncharacterized protein n=1 Tax=Zootermopsis nevadensis TaxID=136037 RepID=A0A067RGU9_ZOONE|nr:hypothetical protein L798_02348 [Zootermopsis nevadensis]
MDNFSSQCLEVFRKEAVSRQDVKMAANTTRACGYEIFDVSDKKCER